MFSFRALGRHVGAACLAGIVSGVLVAGVFGRLAMRVAGFTSRPELIGVQTSNGNRVGEITVEGTLFLALFIGLSAGVVGGLLYASAEPWLRGRRWKGVIFGAALLAALGFRVIDAGNFDFQRFGSAPLNVAMFAALFIAFGAAVAWLFDRIRRAIDGAGRVAAGLEIVALIAAVVGAALAALFFFSAGGLGEPLTALVFAAAIILPAIVRWRGLPRAIAYAAFVAPLLFGALRTLPGIGQLLG